MYAGEDTVETRSEPDSRTRIANRLSSVWVQDRPTPGGEDEKIAGEEF